jgi:hypothetical protein
MWQEHGVDGFEITVAAGESGPVVRLSGNPTYRSPGS